MEEIGIFKGYLNKLLKFTSTGQMLVQSGLLNDC